MKVSELIRRLQEMPADAEVGHIWDGEMRTHINVVWLARSGKVATADFDEIVYDARDRPDEDARVLLPDEYNHSYWKTPPDPNDASWNDR
jgi:hypothetical protein